MKIATRLRMPLPVLAAVSKFATDDMRNVVYDMVAQNRYKMFGESDSCRLMQPEWRDRFLV
jgi:predicted DCC family thiol-disulfide oxidoreductase YuxK